MLEPTRVSSTEVAILRDGNGRIASPFGKYRLERLLGEGASGAVYLAYDTLLERTLALKILDLAGQGRQHERERFLREARAVTGLSHPQVVAVYDINEVGGCPYIAMEWMPGGSAQQALDSRGAIPWDEATRWTLDACLGVAACHRAGFLHRDIKPGNLLLTDAGRVKLADFGLIKWTVAGPQLTHHGGPIGTPSFMSPEQCRNERLDECADVYSLGATYFALLSGRPPYQADSTLGVMFAHCSSPTPALESASGEIPAACEAVVRRAMDKDPDRRFTTADEFADALRAVLGQPAQGVRPARRRSRRFRWAVRRGALAAAAALLAVTALFTWRTSSTPQQPASPQPAPPTVAAVAPAAIAPAVEAPLAAADSEPDAGRPFPSMLVLGDHRGQLADLDFHAEQDAVIAVGTGGALAVWSAGPPRQMIDRFVEADPPEYKLYAQGYFPRHNAVLVGGSPDELLLWDLASRQIVARSKHAHGIVRSIDVAPDGRAFVTGGDLGWNLWELSAGRELTDHGEVSAGLVLVHSVRYAPLHRAVAAASGNGFVWVHSLENPDRSESHSSEDQFLSFAFAHTRCELAYGSRGGQIVMGSSSPRVKSPKPFRIAGGAPLTLEFAHRHRWLAAGDEQGGVTLIDVETGQTIRYATGRKSAVTVLRFSADDARLALGNAQGQVLLAELPVDELSPPTPRSELLLDQALNTLPDPQAAARALEKQSSRRAAESPSP